MGWHTLSAIHSRIANMDHHGHFKEIYAKILLSDPSSVLVRIDFAVRWCLYRISFLQYLKRLKNGKNMLVLNLRIHFIGIEMWHGYEIEKWKKKEKRKKIALSSGQHRMMILNKNKINTFFMRINEFRRLCKSTVCSRITSYILNCASASELRQMNIGSSF